MTSIVYPIRSLVRRSRCIAATGIFASVYHSLAVPRIMQTTSMGSPAIQKLYNMSIQATIQMIPTTYTGPKATILMEVGLHSTLLESTKLIIE